MSAPPPVYDHVLWIVTENHTYDDRRPSARCSQHLQPASRRRFTFVAVSDALQLPEDRFRTVCGAPQPAGLLREHRRRLRPVQRPFTDPPDPSAWFTFVTPNLIHDKRDGTVADGDSWLATFMPKVLSGGEYTAAGAAVFLIWDEGSLSTTTCPRSPSPPPVAPGTKVGARLDHHAMLRATLEITS